MNTKIAYHKRGTKIKSKDSLYKETEKTIRSLIITLSLMIVGLMLVSFIISNNKSQLGYALEQQKIRNEDLKTINSELTTKITKSTSFIGIDENQNVEGMEENSEQIFVTKEDNSVN